MKLKNMEGTNLMRSKNFLSLCVLYEREFGEQRIITTLSINENCGEIIIRVEGNIDWKECLLDNIRYINHLTFLLHLFIS